MIAKKVPMRSVGRSDYGGLVKYLTDRQGKHQRLGYVTVRNCQSEEWQVAILEVLNTQARNTRAVSDKTYHLIVSFRAGEEPVDATLKAIEERICNELGYSEHQRVCVVHHDTDNLHFHIAINKIHPTRHTIHDPYYDHTTLAKVCRKLEQQYGLQPDNHQVLRNGSENRAADMEHHAGVQSLLGWIQRECVEEMRLATSWAELHALLANSGLKIEERGNGLVITDGDCLGVKASSVSRELSKSKDLAELLAFNLEREGYKTIIATDGFEGLANAGNCRPDMVILDLMLPGMLGTEVCKNLKGSQRTSGIPIIMLTAKGEEIDKVVGFEVGADDYVVKPFSSRELLLRVKAVLRRSKNAPTANTVMQVGPITIDSERHVVMVDREEIFFTSTEFKLLHTLAQRLGRVQSRDVLLRDVWGYNFVEDSRTVDTHITRLRTKMGAAGDLVKTVRGFGYKLDAQ